MEKQYLKDKANSAIEHIAATDRPERIVASVIDYFLIAVMSFMPPIGTFFGVLYFFMRDALPFDFKASVGKGIYGFRVLSVDSDERRSLPWYKSVIRNLMILIPGINILDLYSFLRYGQRRSDQWFGIEVVRETAEEQ